MATFVIPFGTVASGLRRWPFNSNFCQFVGFLSAYWAQVSTWILALTLINRYFCVVKTEKYSVFFARKKTILSIVVIWISSLVQTTIVYTSAPVVYRWYPDNLYCRATFLDKRSEKIFFVFCGCFLIIPMSLVVLGYGRVYHEVRQHNTAIVPSLQEASGQQGTVSAQEIKTSRVLFAAVFGYCICWTPFIVILILQFGFRVSIPFYAQSIYPLFAAISSWINPMIYGFMNRSMRKEFRNILFCRKD